jgi:hypothetical protein
MPLSFTEFEVAWAHLQLMVAGAAVTGPLDVAAAQAGERRGTDRLQRSITAQIEQVERDALHRVIAQLDVRDPRREAWYAGDRLSSQLVSSWPTPALECEADAWREMFTTYLGAQSPACRPLVGRTIPVASGVVVCDVYGRRVSSVCLPVETWDACHDAIVGHIDELMLSSGFRPQREPVTRGIFTTLLPPPLLMQSWGRPGVIPDLVADVPMPAIASARGARSGAVLPSRRLLWDVKTMYGGTLQYTGSARAREDQSGAVAARAARVWPAYLAHAVRLDTAHSPPGTTPIEDRLRSYTPTRALVFGSYGEGSTDVHTLLAAAASAQARRVWRRWGSRTESEARGVIMATLRRAMGVFVSREFARHRLRRIPMVGVPRAVLDARRGRSYGGAVMRAGVRMGQGAVSAQDFFAFQAHAAHGAGGLVAAR